MPSVVEQWQAILAAGPPFLARADAGPEPDGQSGLGRSGPGRPVAQRVAAATAVERIAARVKARLLAE